MPKVESLGNFHYDGRMRPRGEQFEMAENEIKQHIELKRVKVVTRATQNSPVTQNRQLEGGVDKTTPAPPAPPSTARTDNTGKVGGNPVPPMSTDVGARDLVANSTAARRATGKASNQGSTAAPAGATPSSNPKAGGKNEDGSPTKQ